MQNLNYSLDPAYKSKLHQQGYLHEKKDSVYKNDFKIYECFENEFGQNYVKKKDDQYFCKMAKVQNKNKVLGLKELMGGGMMAS